MKLSREALFAIGLIAVLLIISIYAAVRDAESAAAPPYISTSNQPQGTKALNMWLDRLEFDVSTQKLNDYEVPSDTSAMVLLEPSNAFTPQEFETLDAWLDEGGTLLVAGDGDVVTQIARHFDIGLEGLFPDPATYRAQSLLMQRTMPWDSTILQIDYVMEPERTDFTTLLAHQETPIAIMFNEGAGRVIISTTIQPFTNAGLQQDGAGGMVLNLISLLDTDKIWIDEWHHGLRNLVDPNAIVGFNSWLRRTPIGQGLFYIAIVSFIALLWRGRRFGRPVPIPNTMSRRAPVEYITAIANLNRRSGNRSVVVDGYRQMLKRRLAQRYRIDAQLADKEFLQQLARTDPTLDTAQIGGLLNRLNRPNLPDDDLVQLGAEITEYCKQ